MKDPYGKADFINGKIIDDLGIEPTTVKLFEKMSIQESIDTMNYLRTIKTTVDLFYEKAKQEALKAIN